MVARRQLLMILWYPIHWSHYSGLQFSIKNLKNKVYKIKNNQFSNLQILFTKVLINQQKIKELFTY